VASAAAAMALNIAPEVIRAGLEQVRFVPGRLQRVEPDDWPFSVLVDYAHTDAALASVLDAVRPITRGRLICVFGCGGDRDRGKRPRMAAVAGRRADLVYVTTDNPRTENPRVIIDDILTGFDAHAMADVAVEEDRGRAIGRAITEARAGDTVLIAGKGHESYQLVGTRRLPFDDVEVARAHLRALVATEQVA
jgi:UDP-N-acetylmuramoyl-L-alanyl-D-glutamate--2,6-diaminopimelate ligase